MYLCRQVRLLSSRLTCKPTFLTQTATCTLLLLLLRCMADRWERREMINVRTRVCQRRHVGTLGLVAVTEGSRGDEVGNRGDTREIREENSEESRGSHEGTRGNHGEAQGNREGTRGNHEGKGKKMKRNHYRLWSRFWPTCQTSKMKTSHASPTNPCLCQYTEDVCMHTGEGVCVCVCMHTGGG